MTNIDRLSGITDGLGIKAPCRVATTANITLSGLQTIDGITLAADERVLVKNQADGTENGIYNASTGTWTRAKDCDGNRDLIEGTLIFVTDGTVSESLFYHCTTTGTIEFDTTSIAFAVITPAAFSLDPTLTALAALNSTAGLVEQTGADTFTKRAIGVAASTSIPTRADADARYQGLDATLTALAAADSTAGLFVQTGSDTFTKRTLTGTANEVTATNGDGVSGNPTLSLPSALTFTGKTVTGGTFSGPALTGTVDVQQALTLSGDITPTQLAANTDNWAPTGFSTASVIRASTDTSRNLTGIAGGSDGRVIVLMNVGSFNLVLKDSATSTAANQFAIGADITLTPKQACTLTYDATSSRWRITGAPALAGAGSGTVTSVATGGLATGGTITAAGTVTVTAATQSDMETGTSTTVAVVPGVQKHHPAHPKAWCYVTQAAGAYTLQTGHGVSAITNLLLACDQNQACGLV
jgi:hypothetical protein